MEAFLGSRVSEEVFCAAEAPKELLGYGSAGRLAFGYPESAGFLWSGAGSAGEKVFYGWNQRRLRLACPAAKLQTEYLRATPEILCPEIRIPKQQALYWFFLDTISSVNAIHWYGRKETPMFHLDAIWSRSAVIGRILTDKIVRGGSRERGVKFLKLLAEQIWALTTWMPFCNRRPDKHILKISDSPIRSTVDASGGKEFKLALKDPEKDRTQIFIRTLTGKTICKQIWTGLLIKNIKDEIQADMGIPSNLQSLIHEGKILQDNFSVRHYGIGRDSTIIISTRLRGGSSGSGPKGSGFFKDVVKGKGEVKKPSPSPDLPGPYIVEQRTQTPALQIDLPEVKKIHSDLASLAVICRFNGFWPKTDALRQWIFSTWTTNCDIHLCSKGFFIVKFDTAKEKDYALHEGPWFWGNAGLFMTPWFPGFDPSTMVVSKMSVWVRLHNLPLHF